VTDGQAAVNHAVDLDPVRPRPGTSVKDLDVGLLITGA
jgi:hypothetical protein